MGIVVHAAHVADADGKGAVPLLAKSAPITAHLEKFLGDTSYNRIFAEAVREKGYQFEKSTHLAAIDTTVTQPEKGKKICRRSPKMGSRKKHCSD